MTRPAHAFPRWNGLFAIPLILALAACGTGAATPSTPAGASTMSPAMSPAMSPRASDTTAPEAQRTNCSLPINLPATVQRAQITDLQVAAHDGYDRVVYTFAVGLPQVTLERATPPFTHDASGAPIQVEGEAFLRLVFHGGTVQLPASGVSYSGVRSMTPRFARLIDLQSAGDFEAVSSWVVGIAGSACVHVSTLEAPSRLVIDVQE